MVIIKGVQIRMARAAVGWGVRELGAEARVTPNTVSRIEGGGVARTDTLERIVTALEAAGVEFIPANGGGPGVRLKE
jgi:transcriptional regulator with XRE-family HTH domain